MGYMDQALDAYKAPTSDDLEITLPTLRTPSKEPEGAGPQGPGQHGGAAGGATPAEGHGDAAAEPAPQRDEPDEGEHTDSTEEQISARAQAVASVEEPEPEPATKPVIDEPVEPAEPEPVVLAQPMSVDKQLEQTEGEAPREFKRNGGASYGPNVELTKVQRLPQPVLDRLRLILAASVGGAFASQISAPALMTAFVMAKTGLELDLDENTAVAAEAFRGTDPRLSVVEGKVDEVLENINILADATKKSLRRIGDSGKILDTLDFAMAYLVADRVAGLTTAEVDETNVDVTQKKVLRARDTIRTSAKAQRAIEREREERSMA